MESILVELRKEFRTDPDLSSERLWPAATGDDVASDAALDVVMSVLHSFKGNAQATGFLAFAAFLQDFESWVALEHALPLAKRIDTRTRLSRWIDFFEDAVIALKMREEEPDLGKSLWKPLMDHGSTAVDWGIFEDAPASMTAMPALLSPSGEPATTEWGVFEELPAREGPTQLTKAVVSKPRATSTSSSLTTPEVVRRVLVCRVGRRVYGIPIEDVQEIIPARLITPLPLSRQDLAGVAIVRGELLPILSIASLGDGSTAATETPQCILICKSKTARFGIMIDEARQAVEIPAGGLEQLPEVIRRSDNSWVAGVVKIAGEHTIVLDLAMLLSSLQQVNRLVNDASAA